MGLGINLSQRADKVASSLLAAASELPPAVTGECDVVVSGGGDYDAYFMGVAMVFDRIPQLRITRYAGASAGGQMPFELVLKGENTTLLTHLSYGVLTGLHPAEYLVPPVAAALQDHHWRLLARWQVDTFGERLPSLDGRVYLALTCLDPLPRFVKVSNFTKKDDQAVRAFIATGSPMEAYEGRLCGDGGATSGQRMTPLFQDGLRSQIIVDLMRTGFPFSEVYRIDVGLYASLVRKGQDDAATFLRTGRLEGAGISGGRGAALELCPRGAKVDQNICESNATRLKEPDGGQREPYLAILA